METITCWTCQKQYRIPENKIPSVGAKVRCAKCGREFVVRSKDHYMEKFSPVIGDYVHEMLRSGEHRVIKGEIERIQLFQKFMSAHYSDVPLHHVQENHVEGYIETIKDYVSEETFSLIQASVSNLYSHLATYEPNQNNAEPIHVTPPALPVVPALETTPNPTDAAKLQESTPVQAEKPEPMTTGKNHELVFVRRPYIDNNRFFGQGHLRVHNQQLTFSGRQWRPSFTFWRLLLLALLVLPTLIWGALAFTNMDLYEEKLATAQQQQATVEAALEETTFKITQFEATAKKSSDPYMIKIWEAYQRFVTESAPITKRFVLVLPADGLGDQKPIDLDHLPPQLAELAAAVSRHELPQASSVDAASKERHNAMLRSMELLHLRQINSDNLLPPLKLVTKGLAAKHLSSQVQLFLAGLLLGLIFWQFPRRFAALLHHKLADTEVTYPLSALEYLELSELILLHLREPESGTLHKYRIAKHMISLALLRQLTDITGHAKKVKMWGG